MARPFAWGLAMLDGKSLLLLFEDCQSFFHPPATFLWQNS